MTPGPLFFHISPEGCAEARLARLFRRNGHRAVCHDTGQLAEDILFARATNGDPLTPWQGTVLFSGLYRDNPHWRPPLEAWRQFGWLAGRDERVAGWQPDLQQIAQGRLRVVRETPAPRTDLRIVFEQS